MRKTGLILGIFLLLSCVSRGFAAPKYEMRGLWVATVYGIDWPSVSGSTPAAAEAAEKGVDGVARYGGLLGIQLGAAPGQAYG